MYAWEFEKILKTLSISADVFVMINAPNITKGYIAHNKTILCQHV